MCRIWQHSTITFSWYFTPPIVSGTRWTSESIEQWVGAFNCFCSTHTAYHSQSHLFHLGISYIHPSISYSSQTKGCNFPPSLKPVFCGTVCCLSGLHCCVLTDRLLNVCLIVWFSVKTWVSPTAFLSMISSMQLICMPYTERFCSFDGYLGIITFSAQTFCVACRVSRNAHQMTQA
jgi:uncharacterized membrane protein